MPNIFAEYFALQLTSNGALKMRSGPNWCGGNGCGMMAYRLPNPIPLMSTPHTSSTSDSTPGHLRPFLPVLLLLFVGSGCAALIYEIVWLQLLQLAVGSSAVSLGVLLGTYMGGMCLGSLLLPRLVCPRSASAANLRASGSWASGSIAIVVLFLIPMLDSLYAAIASHGFQGIFLRAVIAANMPPSADLPNGRFAAGGGALGGSHSARRLLARIPLRRKHRRSGFRLSLRGVLFAAGLRHGGGDLHRGVDQLRRWRLSASCWLSGRRIERRQRAANILSRRNEPWDRLHRHRSLGHVRPRRGGNLDPAAFGDDRRDRLHVLASSSRYS